MVSVLPGISITYTPFYLGSMPYAFLVSGKGGQRTRHDKISSWLLNSTSLATIPKIWENTQ